MRKRIPWLLTFVVAAVALATFQEDANAYNPYGPRVDVGGTSGVRVVVLSLSEDSPSSYHGSIIDAPSSISGGRA